MATLTPWSRFRFYAGGFFCLLGGIANTPDAFRGDVGGAFAGSLFYALVAFGIAYAVRGRKKVRNWNAVAQWFFWVSLILPVLTYSGKIGLK